MTTWRASMILLLGFTAGCSASPSLDDGDDDVVRRVRANGCLRCRPKGQRRVDLQLAAAFADQTVAVRPSADNGLHHVYFMTWRIAAVDFRTNPDRPSVTHLLEHL